MFGVSRSFIRTVSPSLFTTGLGIAERLFPNFQSFFTRFMLPEVRIHNIVVSAILGVELNLDVIADAFPQRVRYRRKPPSVVFRLENSRVVVLLFENGKLVCVGAKSKGEAMRPCGGWLSC